MNETRSNLDVRGYVHTSNRDLTADEIAGMNREGLIRILVSAALWLLFPFCLLFMVAGLASIADTGRGADIDPVLKWVMLPACAAVGLELAGALTQGSRGRLLCADAKAGVVNVYEHRQVHPQQRPQVLWNGTPVSRVEVLPKSQRVWSVNGAPVTRGWDALR